MVLAEGEVAPDVSRNQAPRREERTVNVLDWILVLVGVFSVLRGLWRGAVSQIFGILGFVGGFYLAYRHGEALGARLAGSFPSIPQPVLISYALLFLLSWFLIALAGAWISRGLHSGGLGGPDRLIGGALGLVKGVLAALLLVWGITLLVPPDHALLQRSRLAPYVRQAIQFLVEAAPMSFREKWEERLKKTPMPPPGKKVQPPGSEGEKNDGAGKSQSGKRTL